MCKIMNGSEYLTFGSYTEAVKHISTRLAGAAYQMKEVAFESLRGKKTPVAFDIITVHGAEYALDKCEGYWLLEPA